MFPPRSHLPLLVALLAAFAACLLPAAAWAVDPQPHPENIFKTGSDVVVGPDEVVGTVILLGGDLKVVGRVEGSAVVVGGDVRVLPTGVVARAVVCLGGRVRRDPGAVVAGNVVALGGHDTITRIGAAFYRSVRSPFRPGTMIGWAASTVLYLAVALVAAAFFPRATIAVRDRTGRRPGASLGWGALGSLVVVPAVSVLLLISVIGILVLIPWLLVAVPLAFFFGFACLSALVGGWGLRAVGYGHQNLMLAAVTGALALHIVRLIPYLGATVWAGVWVTGFGAVSAAVWEWWRGRRARHGGKGEPAPA